MHEYGVALEIAEMALSRAGGRKITKVNLRAGDLSGVLPESLFMYCELIFRDRGKEPPAVKIERVPTLFLCACGCRYSPAEPFGPCPSCGGGERTIIEGNQCVIESIEVEDG